MQHLASDLVQKPEACNIARMPCSAPPALSIACRPELPGQLQPGTRTVHHRHLGCTGTRPSPLAVSCCCDAAMMLAWHVSAPLVVDGVCSS